MKHKLNELKNKILNNKFFLRNFLLIFIVMAIIFLIYSLYTYHNSRNIIEEEFTSSGLQDLENMSSYVDNFVTDTRYMISTLAINDFIQIFFASDSPEALFQDYFKRVQGQLLTLVHSNNAIEAIYLYSEASDSICTANQCLPLSSFHDRGWFEYLHPDKNGFSIFPYAMNTKFPYVICVTKEFMVNGRRSIITILINPSKLPILNQIGENSYQEAYMISDTDMIFYRYHQRELLEPLNTSEYLAHYESDADQKTMIYSKTNKPYSFIQLHSSVYSWSFVLITHLQDYTSKLSSSRAVLYSLSSISIIFAVLFAVFFSLRSLKPVRDIRKFLDNPELLSSDNTNTDSDIQYIAGCITQYIQTNKQLGNELNKRLNLLNETQMLALQSQINPHFLFNTLNMMHILATDSLGYDHALPQMTLNLSALLRYALEPAEMVTLMKELSYTDIYLSILNQRYGEKLNVIQEISPDTMNAKVPKLFIQPIIENAVFHGFSKKHDSECILTIICYKESLLKADTYKDYMIVKVKDNGMGMNEKILTQLRDILADKKTPSGKSIGLRNVMQRMSLTYSEPCSIEIDSIVNEGACFTLTFPYIE